MVSGVPSSGSGTWIGERGELGRGWGGLNGGRGVELSQTDIL